MQIEARNIQPGMTITTESGNNIAVTRINRNAVTVTAYDANGTAYSISSYATVTAL